ncbi:MAG: amidohydrolase family protein [Thermomicrobiales bacterium]|nr:amidohydrolase family protein [Thermomicrobiales bacterium]
MRVWDREITLLSNGNVRTLDAANRVEEAIAMQGDRILAVGTSAELEAAFANVRRIDLAGRTALPGLIDAHTHLEGTALHLVYFADCHAPPHTDLAGMLGALSRHAEDQPDAEWVIGQGSFMLAEKLAERRYPTLAEMDAAVPDRPALIRAGAHISIVNSVALRRLGMDRDDYAPPPGGHVVRDADGNPTGKLTELYWHMGLPPFTPEQTVKAVARIAGQLSSYGITSLQDQFPSAAGLRAYKQLHREGRLPLRITFTAHCPNLASVKQFLKLGLESGFGDDNLRLGAVKFFVDGGITGAAGAFYDDYAHQPGNRGHLKVERDELFEMVRLIDAAGCQISTHVVGDRALDMLLDAYEAIPNPSGKRHRLEHAGHLCMNPQRIGRIRNLGLIPVVTMPFLSSFGDFLAEYLGERANGAFALRRLLDAGLVVPGSSDSLGAQPESLNPWFGIWCSVARETYGGKLLAPEETVSVEEALHTYTTAAAYADFAEERVGTIEPGKLADLIVCDTDPLGVETAALPHVRPVATILGGTVVAGSLATA